MRTTLAPVRRLAIAAIAAALVGAAASPLSAQTTLVLDQAADTTLRAGDYATVNYGTEDLYTKHAPKASYTRRALLKFDTHTTIPAGAAIGSAKLTLTLKSAGADPVRRLSVYAEPSPFDDAAATWELRKAGIAWRTPGGDLAGRYGTVDVPAAPGTRIEIDLTALVQAVVNQPDTRYTRVLLVDEGTQTATSDRIFYSAEAVDSTVRPSLVVVYGTGVTAPVPPTPSGGNPTSIRVLQWNIHHGVGTDGKYDIVRLATWIAAMRPDLVSLNEVERYNGSYGNEDQPARFAALLEQKTGERWYYHFAQRNGSTKGQGNLVLSRHPIDSTATAVLSYSRSAAAATTTIQGRVVTVISTHLDADYSSRRLTQIGQLLPFARNLPENRLLLGDFNASPSSTEMKTVCAEYRDAWAQAKSAGTAVAYPANPNGNTRNSRIDYVLLSRQATGLVLTGAQVVDTRDAKGVRPSDHHPLIATYELR